MRPPHGGDLAEVVRLMSEHAPEPFDEETLRREGSAPGVDLDPDARVEDGAYAFVERFDGDRVWLEVHGRPSSELLDWAEGRADELGTRILSGGWSENRTVCEELVRRGFRLVRHSSRMHIDLAEPTDEPVWPQGVRLRTSSPATSVSSTTSTRRRSATPGSRSRSRTASGPTGS